jgi:hypothetical protein
MLSVYVSLLRETNVHLTRALESLEEVPAGVFADPQDRYSLQELIARAGGIVNSELAREEGS